MNAGTSLAEKSRGARHRADTGFGRFAGFGRLGWFIYLLPFDRGQIQTAKPNARASVDFVDVSTGGVAVGCCLLAVRAWVPFNTSRCGSFAARAFASADDTKRLNSEH
jgi:hypothetical protein